MNSSRPLTALAEAQAALMAMLAPVAPCAAACAEAVGLVAAEQAPLRHAAPLRAYALRAGYALRAQDLAGASSFAPAFLSSAPQAVAVGDALPDGCDCVLDATSLDLSGPAPQAFAEAYPGENARRAGEDYPAGAPVISAGRKITAHDALAAARAGMTEFFVRRPRVAIAGETQGDIAALAARMVQARGADVVQPDDSADLVVAIGAMASATWTTLGLALEPGRDMAIGRVGATPAVLLPASPGGAVAGCVALLRPAMDRLTAFVRPEPRALPLASKIASRVGVAEVALLREEGGRFTPLAVGDAPLHCLTRATHAAIVAAGSEGLGAGEVCAAEPLDA